MSASSRRPRRTKNEINMVPFIDVMLVLLIIFMVTAPLISPSQIDLPSAGEAARPPDKFVEVILDKSEQLQVRMNTDNTTTPIVPEKQMIARVQALRGEANDMPVRVSADKNVKYDAVMSIVKQLRAAGVNRVALATI